jgi:hypothetical protein
MIGKSGVDKLLEDSQRWAEVERLPYEGEQDDFNE